MHSVNLHMRTSVALIHLLIVFPSASAPSAHNRYIVIHVSPTLGALKHVVLLSHTLWSFPLTQ